MKTLPGNTRRDFLSRMLGAWSLLTVAPIAKAILDYVTPKPAASVDQEIIKLISTSEMELNTARVFKVNKEPVILVHTETGQYRAFGARCTHLGCVVKYNTEEGPPHFSCNCHGSEFDITGKNIEGPAPKPLTPYKVILRDTTIFVSHT